LRKSGKKKKKKGWAGEDCLWTETVLEKKDFLKKVATVVKDVLDSTRIFNGGEKNCGSKGEIRFYQYPPRGGSLKRDLIQGEGWPRYRTFDRGKKLYHRKAKR